MSDAALAARLEAVRRRMAQAAEHARAPQRGQPDSCAILVAVSKRQSVDAVCALYDLGVRDFGENYAQEMQHKAAALRRTGRRPRWHFIGALQSNKIARIAQIADVVHTVTSVAQARALCQARAKDPAASGPDARPPLQWLMQVRLVDDPTRPGVDVQDAQALATQWATWALPGWVGLMGVPPQGEDPVPHFARLRALRDAMAGAPHGLTRHVQALSMGMSEDFAAALGEGATMVRVGSALFGPRPP